jgi:dTMP kinase
MLITVEGVDGAGKTTLVASLAEALRERGRPVEVLREPGGVELSERIRALVMDPDIRVDDRAEALLYAAARAQLVDERLRPLLDAGADVVMDRFVDSSLAYQGAARGLGFAHVASINAVATGGVHPDRTLYLRVDPAVSRARQGERGEPADRLEQAGDAFFERVAEAYDAMAEGDPQRFVVIDATQSPEQVLREALAALGYRSA